MNNQIRIKVADLIGSPLGISAEDGQKVFGKVEQLVKAGKEVTISFENITMLISLFLNVAIGQLYGSFNEATLSVPMNTCLWTQISGFIFSLRPQTRQTDLQNSTQLLSPILLQHTLNQFLIQWC